MAQAIVQMSTAPWFPRQCLGLYVGYITLEAQPRDPSCQYPRNQPTLAPVVVAGPFTDPMKRQMDFFSGNMQANQSGQQVAPCFYCCNFPPDSGQRKETLAVWGIDDARRVRSRKDN